MRVAAIDIGSNSIHMVIAEIETDGRFRILDRAKDNVRLGSRTLTEGHLSDESMAAGIRTLASFQTLAERQRVTRIQAVATCAVREAANGGAFVQRVKHETGLRVHVIPGREEARLIFLGVAHALNLRSEPTAIVDIGGGSVELILCEDGVATALHSVKLGVTRLSELFVTDDPPSIKRLRALETHIADTLVGIVAEFRRHDVRRVIGTSGTILNLIALVGHRRGTGFSSDHLDNYEVTAAELGEMRRLLERADRRTRLTMKGLDAKRVDLIVPGAILVDHVMRASGAERLVGCTWALREGVLLDFIARHPRKIADAEHYSDPRRRSVARLRRRFGDFGPHAEHVAFLADQLFDQLAAPLGLPEESREILEFAALLHDIGHHIRHQSHHQHTYYLIMNCELLGFRRDEIEMIALTARFHRKAPPKESDPLLAGLSKVDRRTLRALIALLRVADGLDRTHYGVVRAVTVRRDGRRIAVVLDTAGEDAEMEVWEAARRGVLLGQLLDGALEIDAINDVDRGPRSAVPGRS